MDYKLRKLRLRNKKEHNHYMGFLYANDTDPYRNRPKLSSIMDHVINTSVDTSTFDNELKTISSNVIGVCMGGLRY